MFFKIFSVRKVLPCDHIDSVAVKDISAVKIMVVDPLIQDICMIFDNLDIDKYI